jgi:hypothetical protein
MKIKGVQMAESVDWKACALAYAAMGPQQAKAVEQAKQQALSQLTDNTYGYWESVYTLARQDSAPDAPDVRPPSPRLVP